MVSLLADVAAARRTVMIAHAYVISNKDNESHFYLNEMLSEYRAALLLVETDDENRRSEAFRLEIIEAGRQNGIFWFDVEERARKLVSIIATDKDDDDTVQV